MLPLSAAMAPEVARLRELAPTEEGTTEGAPETASDRLGVGAEVVTVDSAIARLVASERVVGWTQLSVPSVAPDAA